ncbi:M20/M25/M40 family metallo-hydrolase, partial [candidate division KSB1 bacterium]
VKVLTDLGLEVEVDECGKEFGSNYGNIFAKFKGSDPNRPTIILSAHMDTVVPGTDIKPVIEGDTIKSDGSTVLGSDDKSGIAIIIEVIKNIIEEKSPSGDIEIIFSISEETGLQGAKGFDVSKLNGKLGYALDSTEPDEVYIGAPSAVTIDIKIFGLAAHAGIAPEKGINAIKVASEAIAKMKIGRHDEDLFEPAGFFVGQTKQD